MAEHSERWAAYFYDGTTVMRNEHGIRDAAELRKVWYDAADQRIRQLGEFRLERISQSPILWEVNRTVAISFRLERISQSPILCSPTCSLGWRFRLERISQSPIL